MQSQEKGHTRYIIIPCVIATFPVRRLIFQQMNNLCILTVRSFHFSSQCYFTLLFAQDSLPLFNIESMEMH